MANNPLLDLSTLPAFDQISAEHVIPALEAMLSEHRQKITEVEKQDEPGWQNFVSQLENLVSKRHRIAHLLLK